MSFNQNGQKNENQNWKIQTQTTPQLTTQHHQQTFRDTIQSTFYSDSEHLGGGGRPNGFNATSDEHVVGNINRPLKNSDPSDANVRPSGVTTMRTDFSGLFTGKKKNLIIEKSFHLNDNTSQIYRNKFSFKHCLLIFRWSSIF